MTFELDNGSNASLQLGTNTPVYIKSTDLPTEIAGEIGAAIEAADLNVTVYTDTTLERVEIVSKATPSTLSVTLGAAKTGNALTLEGDGPGNGGNATVGGTANASDGYTTIPVNFSMTAAQVAQEVVTVMNTTMNVNPQGQTAITGIDAANVPHLAALNGETFQMTVNKGKAVTFEFIDTSGTTKLTKGDVQISYNSATNAIGNVLTNMVTAINASGLAVTAAALPSGISLTGTAVTANMSATPFQWAVDNSSVLLDATQANLIHMIGESVIEQEEVVQGTTTTTYGPIAYSAPWENPNGNSGGTSSLPDDFRPVLPAVSNGQTIQAGQSGTGAGYGGVYIDDIIVGFDERGEMLTAATPDTTFDPVPASQLPDNGADLITTGSYVLQIQRAPQYGTLTYEVRNRIR